MFPYVQASTYTASAMEEAVKAAMELAGGGCSGVCTASGAADDRRECSNLPFVPPAGMSQEEVANCKNDIREVRETTLHPDHQYEDRVLNGVFMMPDCRRPGRHPVHRAPS